MRIACLTANAARPLSLARCALLAWLLPGCFEIPARGFENPCDPAVDSGGCVAPLPDALAPRLDAGGGALDMSATDGLTPDGPPVPESGLDPDSRPDPDAAPEPDGFHCEQIESIGSARDQECQSAATCGSGGICVGAEGGVSRCVQACAPERCERPPCQAGEGCISLRGESGPLTFPDGVTPLGGCRQLAGSLGLCGGRNDCPEQHRCVGLLGTPAICWPICTRGGPPCNAPMTCSLALDDPQGTTRLCVAPCVTSSDCPAGFHCSNIGNQSELCVPDG